MRIFIAIPTPVRKIAVKSSEGIKIVPVKKRHLTIRFFKNIDAGRLENIIGKIKNEDDLFCFKIKTGPAIILPDRKKPQVLALKITEGYGALHCFKKRIDKICRNTGKRDRRWFVPHITIARIKKYYSKKYLTELIEKINKTKISTITVRNIQIIKSDFCTTGSRYTILKTIDLQNLAGSRF